MLYLISSYLTETMSNITTFNGVEGEECELFCSPKLPYLRTVPHHFSSRLNELVMRTLWFHIAVTRLGSILECSVFICLTRQCYVLFITYKLITSNCWLDNKIIILHERGKQRLMFAEYQSMKYEYFSRLVFNPLMSILPRKRFCLVKQRSFFLIVEERCVTRQKRLQGRLFKHK